MQVKTQVALAVADQHLLENKQKDNLASQQDWVRKAELALNKGDEALARMALERSLTFETAAQNFSQQIEDQAHQVEMLKTALYRLEQKMAETRSKADLLIAQHRRAKLSERAGTAALEEFGQDAAFVRMRNKVQEADAIGEGHLALAEESPEKRLEQLEKADKVEKLLENLKAQRQ